MRTRKTLQRLFLIIVVAVIIGFKLISFSDNLLSISYSFFTKQNQDDFEASNNISRKENYFKYFENNKHTTNDNINSDKFENIWAVMKLKQMIFSNAQRQLFLRARFKL